MEQEPTINRIPALDGWRGIAILLVLIDHIEHAVLHRYAMPWMQTGQHGVTIFFVLSGFLITAKLLEGPIHLGQFYLRRLFRLMPVAWTYLAAMLLFDGLMHTHFTSSAEVRACLFFYRNFAGGADGGASGHFWSLSLEEQFYLVWPVLLLLAGVRRTRWIAVALTLACATYRWLFWAWYDRNVWNGQTQVRCDALLVGCLLAFLLAEPRFLTAARRWANRLAVPALATLVFCIVRFHWLAPLYECVAITVLLAASILYPQTVFAQLLSLKPLAWLGTISYSIYVWQALFMLPWSSAVRSWLFCVALPLFAIASYYWIEKPSTRFGRRLTEAPVSVRGANNFLLGNSRRRHSDASLPIQQK